MIEIQVNNDRTMRVVQNNQYGDINVTTGKYDDIDGDFDITAADFVMLMNYYKHVKQNNIQCDFINPQGDQWLYTARKFNDK
jgi:hypothetical protein